MYCPPRTDSPKSCQVLRKVAVKSARLHGFARGLGHIHAAFGIIRQGQHAAGKAVRVACLGHEPGRVGLDVFLRPALIRDDGGQARGLGFQDHVAEGVRCRREDEDVRAGIGLGQILAFEQGR